MILENAWEQRMFTTIQKRTIDIKKHLDGYIQSTDA